ncbi:RcnB family protein [Erwinia oleae]|uniref:RcnB family protein n=1 Tax=Erwinia oleae TaxID=796334 RepID=UPI0005503F3E|nr:RcnB family protein [Erwinia oleae]
MSKSTVAVFSALLLGALPVMGAAWAEGEQAVPAPQIQSATPEQPAPAAGEQQSQPQVSGEGQESPAPQGQQPSASNPDGETAPAVPGKKTYDKTSFYADFKHFQIGDVVPDTYRVPKYKISEWQKRKLTAPEPGSHWTYMGGDYVLITDAEGKIVKVLSGDIIYR